MSGFDDRENAFENKFVHDADMQFKVGARRNKLLGLWAADLLGKTSEEASIYATEVVKSDFEEAGDEDVYRKVSGDLGDLADEATVRAKMAQFLTSASHGYSIISTGRVKLRIGDFSLYLNYKRKRYRLKYTFRF